MKGQTSPATKASTCPMQTTFGHATVHFDQDLEGTALPKHHVRESIQAHHHAPGGHRETSAQMPARLSALAAALGITQVWTKTSDLVCTSFCPVPWACLGVSSRWLQILDYSPINHGPLRALVACCFGQRGFLGTLDDSSLVWNARATPSNPVPWDAPSGPAMRHESPKLPDRGKYNARS